MKLDELQLKTEVRTPWQAIDLGVPVARRWYRSLLLAWLIPACVIYLVAAGIGYERPWVALLAVWWLKPLFDRLPLMLLSRYIFNDRAEGVLRWRQLLRLYLFDAFAALTWRRLDPKRSFLLAVTVLERQKGRNRSRRCETLSLGSGGAATWLTLVMVHLEMLVPAAVLTLLMLFLSNYLQIDLFRFFSGDENLYTHLGNLLMLGGMSLVAPFYIASGFSLYLNRRIELEAWDLELLFRESMKRRAEGVVAVSGVSPRGSALAVICLLAFALVSPIGAPPLQAAEMPIAATEEHSSKEAILTLLESPPFVIEKEVTQWEWKDSGDDRSQDPGDLPDWVKALFGPSNGADLAWLFKLAELLAWLGILWLVWFIVRALLPYFKQVSSAPLTKSVEKPKVIMGMAISAESLPEDIDAEVAAALQRGEMRLAVSLIYRHTLHQLVHRYQVPVESWYTELECAAAVKRQPELALGGVFDDLTQVWLRLAYAHEVPEPSRIESLQSELKRVLTP